MIQPSKLSKHWENKKCYRIEINCNHRHQSYPNTKCFHSEIYCNPNIEALQTLGEEKRQRQSLDLGEYTYRVSQRIVKLDEIILWIMHCNYTIYNTLSRSWGSLDALAPPSTPEHRRYRWVWTKILSTFFATTSFCNDYFPFLLLSQSRVCPKNALLWLYYLHPKILKFRANLVAIASKELGVMIWVSQFVGNS